MKIEGTRQRSGWPLAILAGFLASVSGAFATIPFLAAETGPRDEAVYLTALAGLIPQALSFVIGFGFTTLIVKARHKDKNLNLNPNVRFWIVVALPTALMFAGSFLPWGIKLLSFFPFFLLFMPWMSKIYFNSLMGQPIYPRPRYLFGYWFFSGFCIAFAVILGFSVIGLLVAPFLMGGVIMMHAQEFERAAGFIEHEPAWQPQNDANSMDTSDFS